jgi:hypothetical protein
MSDSVHTVEAAVRRVDLEGSDKNSQLRKPTAFRHNAFTIAGSSLKDREHLLKREEFIHT